MLDRSIKGVLLVILIVVAVWLVSCTAEMVSISRDPAGFVEETIREMEKAIERQSP